MYIIDRSVRFTRGAIASYAPSAIKKMFWDWDFSRGYWQFLDDTAGDCVYQHLVKHTKGGSILDLGCGPGNTANELAASAYSNYTGVDISDSALDKARRRSETNCRSGKNSFFQGDFLTYAPVQKFDVILFRESMYHVPLGKIDAILSRYSTYLKGGGVFIVRLVTSHKGVAIARPTAMVRVIEVGFDVIEKTYYEETGSTVIAFRSRGASSFESCHEQTLPGTQERRLKPRERTLLPGLQRAAW